MKTCTIEGCDKKERAKGLCVAHYWKLKEYGDPLAGKTYTKRTSDECSVKGCKNRVVTRGLCAKHYTERWRRGEFTTNKSKYNGMSKSATYRAWYDMIQRCTNPNDKMYKYYGGKGIRVSKRWTGEHGFENFLKDMDEKPGPEYHLHRINTHRNYSPKNCQWVKGQVHLRLHADARRRGIYEMSVIDTSRSEEEWRELEREVEDYLASLSR